MVRPYHLPSSRRRPQASVPSHRFQALGQGRRARQGCRDRVRSEPLRRIALLHFADGEKRYIIAPKGIKQGDVIETGAQADIKPGNNLPLKNIPTVPWFMTSSSARWAALRSFVPLGAAVQLVAKDGAYAQLRMPSGEIPNVDARCRATVGEVGNEDHANIQLGKAGRARWIGRRPITRGESMNPVDHPTAVVPAVVSRRSPRGARARFVLVVRRRLRTR